MKRVTEETRTEVTRDVRNAITFSPGIYSKFWVECDEERDRGRYVVNMGTGPGRRAYIELLVTPEQIGDLATQLGFLAQDIDRQERERTETHHKVEELAEAFAR